MWYVCGGCGCVWMCVCVCARHLHGGHRLVVRLCACVRVRVHVRVCVPPKRHLKTESRNPPRPPRSAGCVFGELLQRVPWLGKATTPHLQARRTTRGAGRGRRRAAALCLRAQRSQPAAARRAPQVAPVFAMHGMPDTPASGDRFASGGHPAGNSVTRCELKALFQVIGARARARGAPAPLPCTPLSLRASPCARRPNPSPAAPPQTPQTPQTPPPQARPAGSASSQSPAAPGASTCAASPGARRASSGALARRARSRSTCCSA